MLENNDEHVSYYLPTLKSLHYELFEKRKQSSSHRFILALSPVALKTLVHIYQGQNFTDLTYWREKGRGSSDRLDETCLSSCFVHLPFLLPTCCLPPTPPPPPAAPLSPPLSTKCAQSTLRRSRGTCTPTSWRQPAYLSTYPFTAILRLSGETSANTAASPLLYFETIKQEPPGIALLTSRGVKSYEYHHSHNRHPPPRKKKSTFL